MRADEYGSHDLNKYSSTNLLSEYHHQQLQCLAIIVPNILISNFQQFYDPVFSMLLVFYIGKEDKHLF